MDDNNQEQWEGKVSGRSLPWVHPRGRDRANDHDYDDDDDTLVMYRVMGDCQYHTHHRQGRGPRSRPRRRHVSVWTPPPPGLLCEFFSPPPIPSLPLIAILLIGCTAPDPRCINGAYDDPLLLLQESQHRRDLFHPRPEEERSIKGVRKVLGVNVNLYLFSRVHHDPLSLLRFVWQWSSRWLLSFFPSPTVHL